MSHYGKGPTRTRKCVETALEICLTRVLKVQHRICAQPPTDTTLQVQRAILVSRPRSSLISTVQTITLRPR